MDGGTTDGIRRMAMKNEESDKLVCENEGLDDARDWQCKRKQRVLTAGLVQGVTLSSTHQWVRYNAARSRRITKWNNSQPTCRMHESCC